MAFAHPGQPVVDLLPQRPLHLDRFPTSGSATAYPLVVRHCSAGIFHLDRLFSGHRFVEDHANPGEKLPRLDFELGLRRRGIESGRIRHLPGKVLSLEQLGLVPASKGSVFGRTAPVHQPVDKSAFFCVYDDIYGLLAGVLPDVYFSASLQRIGSH